MIDEKKLIEDLKEFAEDKDCLELYGDVLKLIIGDCIIEVEKQPKIGEWIPCNEDNLPDKEVLCQDNHGEMMLGHVFESDEFPGSFDAESEHEYMYDCVAWMPKPKMYRKDGANG